MDKACHLRLFNIELVVIGSVLIMRQHLVKEIGHIASVQNFHNNRYETTDGGGVHVTVAVEI